MFLNLECSGLLFILIRHLFFPIVIYLRLIKISLVFSFKEQAIEATCQNLIEALNYSSHVVILLLFSSVRVNLYPFMMKSLSVDAD